MSGSKGQVLDHEECHVSSHMSDQLKPQSPGFCPKAPLEIASLSPAISKGLVSLALWSLCVWKEGLVKGRGPPLMETQPKDRVPGSAQKTKVLTWGPRRLQRLAADHSPWGPGSIHIFRSLSPAASMGTLTRSAVDHKSGAHYAPPTPGVSTGRRILCAGPVPGVSQMVSQFSLTMGP